MLHITLTKVLISYLLTAQKTNKQETHKRAYLPEHGDLGQRKSGEWAKIIKGYGRKSNRTRQNNKRGTIEKWD